MFCYSCGKVIKEEAKYCAYCGARQQGSLKDSEAVSSEANTSANSSSSIKQPSDYILTALVIILGLVIIIGVFLMITNYHECDMCNRKYFGAAYYDSLGDYDTMCEDCAKRYYAPFNYKQFK